MPIVKRFRALGEVVQGDCSNVESKPLEPVSGSLLQPKQKVVRRFQMESKPRRKRKDSKHKFPLRVDRELWGKVEELSFSCGSINKGASLNVICNRLLYFALEDQDIVKKILDEFPGNTRSIVIRTWRD